MLRAQADQASRAGKLGLVLARSAYFPQPCEQADKPQHRVRGPKSAQRQFEDFPNIIFHLNF
jgi:hypothetical protein